MREIAPIALSVLACALAISAVLFMAIPAPGQQVGDRWEYKVLDFNEVIVDVHFSDQDIREAKKLGIYKARNLEDAFNQLGADRWEMVAYTATTAVFKRRF